MKLKHTREGPGRINFQDTVDTQKPIRFSLTGRGTGKAGTSQLTSGSLTVEETRREVLGMPGTSEREEGWDAQGRAFRWETCRSVRKGQLKH